MPRKLEIQVLADTRDLERALSRASRTTQTSFQKIGKAAGVAGLALGGALAVAAKVGFDELAQGQRVAAQTAAVIESTGGAANVTAKEVENLSEALMQKSGVDDEVIASGQNMLLTFRNVRDEVGKGNDIFTQATKLTLDLSVALGRDMPDAALMVGKALNDPIRGLTALRRVGVQFTKAEEESIKAMVEAGDVMGAQKIILAELRKEFGGSAEAAGKTLPGQLSIAKESFRNLSAELLTALLPALTSLVQRLNGLAQFFAKNQGAAKALVITAASLATALLAVSVATKTYTAAVRVATAATVLLGIAQKNLPIVRLIFLIVAVGTAVVVAYRKFETFRNIVTRAIDFVRRHWQLLLLALGPIGAVILLIIRRFETFRSVAVRMLGFAAAAARSLASAFSTVVGWIQAAVNAVSRLAGAIRSLPSLPSLDDSLIDIIRGRQHGGPVAARTPYIVGERGPELFVPRSAGTVVPNSRLRGAGGGGTVVVPVYLDGRQIAEAMFDPLRNKVSQYKSTNGGRSPL